MIELDPTLAKDASEAVRLYALSASRQVTEVSDRAREALSRIDDQTIVLQVQDALLRMGQAIGQADGVLGPKTRQAAMVALEGDAPSDTRELLVSLIRREWISSQPRLDML